MIFDEKCMELIDVNKINNGYFIYVAASGFLTNITYDVSSKIKKRYGYLSYVQEALKKIKYKPVHQLKITANNETAIVESVLTLVLSANKFGGLNFYKFEKDCKLNDGLIQLRTFINKKNIVMRLIRFVIRFGAPQQSNYSVKSNKIIIEPVSKLTLNWNCDGENKTKNKVDIKVLQKTLKMTINPKIRKKLF